MSKKWENKDSVKNIQEAMEALSDFLSSSEGIGGITGEYYNSHNPSILNEAQAFADKWSIPFSSNFMNKVVNDMSRKRWNGEGEPLTKEAWAEKELDLSDINKFDPQTGEKNPNYEKEVEEALLNSSADYDRYREEYGWYGGEGHIWQSSSESC